MTVIRLPSPVTPSHTIGVAPVPTHEEQPGLRYLEYMPRQVNPDLEPLVFVHGYTRRADEQLQQLKALADATGRALLAPFFGKTQHPRYQRLGKGVDGPRADRYFDACLEDAASRLGLRSDRFVLMGYSGGAQFAHRYAMVYPHRVARLIAIAAGWYTFPDREKSYPYGLATAGKLRRVSMNPETFLQVPMTVLVGARDFDTTNLRSNPRLDSQQGTSRVERARRWVLAMRMAARLYRVKADIVYQEVPGIGHSFTQFVAKGCLRELVLAAINEGVNDGATAMQGDCSQSGFGRGT